MNTSNSAGVHKPTYQELEQHVKKLNEHNKFLESNAGLKHEQARKLTYEKDALEQRVKDLEEFVNLHTLAGDRVHNCKMLLSQQSKIITTLELRCARLEYLTKEAQSHLISIRNIGQSPAPSVSATIGKIDNYFSQSSPSAPVDAEQSPEHGSKRLVPLKRKYKCSVCGKFTEVEYPGLLIETELESSPSQVVEQLGRIKAGIETIGCRTDHGDQEPCLICKTVDELLALPIFNILGDKK